ncbi:MAG: MarR family winged helix-turn-helix transcriptional regulator [Candidatus Thorarchaeota archaeon]
MEKLKQGGFLITKIRQLMLKVFDKLLDDYKISEITAAQGRVMFPIWKEDNISFQDLKKKAMLSKATLSYMLDKLEEAGHIERIRSDKDKRTIHIKLTRRNKYLQEKYVDVSLKMASIFYNNFTDKEIDEFETYLKKILENLIHYYKDHKENEE